MKKVVLATLVFASALCAQNKPIPADTNIDLWRALQFLIGTWEAKTRGGSGGASGAGTYTFQMELQGHLLARRTNSLECKGPSDFNCEHSDLLYVYAEAPSGPLKVVFFDNEGHVIHYDVSAPNAASVVFVSEPSLKGPQYRLSYELKGNELFGKFEIRMPGQGEFKAYLEWSGVRK